MVNHQIQQRPPQAGFNQNQAPMAQNPYQFQQPVQQMPQRLHAPAPMMAGLSPNMHLQHRTLKQQGRTFTLDMAQNINQHMHQVTKSVKNMQELTDYIKKAIHQAHYNAFTHGMPWDHNTQQRFMGILNSHLQSTDLFNKIPRPQIQAALSSLIKQMLPNYFAGPEGCYFKAFKKDAVNKRKEATHIRTADGQLFELLNSPTEKQIQEINAKAEMFLNAGKNILGEGSFGKVRLARNLVTGEIVAVKKMNNTEMAKNELKTFEDIQSNKNLTTPYGYAHIQKNGKDKSYIFMPLFNQGDGLAAAQYIDLTRIINNSDAEALFKDTFAAYLDATATLHSQNTAHRDIKPDNFLHSSTKGISLSDFGLSIKDSEIPKTHSAGTNMYLAPERSTKTFTPKGQDAFSLGITGLCLNNNIYPHQMLVPHLMVQGTPITLTFDHLNNCYGVSPFDPAIQQPLSYTTKDEVIAGLLMNDPMFRLTPQDALNTPWLRDTALKLNSAHVHPITNINPMDLMMR